MIQPLHRTRIVALEPPLPPVWVRVQPTGPDRTERVGSSLFRVGPEGALRRALVESIDAAREVVLLASFLLGDDGLADALVRASTRGVRVYVLTASETRLAAYVRQDDAFEARMVEEHKRLLDRLADHVTLRSAEHFHAKFVVTDPAHSASGWVSTANFNRALQESVELGVKLSARAARQLAAWFSWMFWNEAERELTEKGRLAKVAPPPAQPPRPTTDPVFVTARDETSLRETVLGMVRQAQSRLLVASYGLEADHEVVLAIEERARAGVPVTLLTRVRPAVFPAVQRLAEAGVVVLAHDKLHAKAIFADNRAVVMSANLETHGMDTGFEVGVLLSGNEALAVGKTLEDWSARFPWRYEPKLARKRHLGEVCLASDPLKTGCRTVVEELTIKLDSVTATSALDLEGAPDPTLASPNEAGNFYQRVRYEWEVRPPHLPGKASEVRREVVTTQRDKKGNEKVVRVKQAYDPPVYAFGGRKLVLLAKPDQTSAARRLAEELQAAVVIP